MAEELVYISIGSNIEPEVHVPAGVAALAQHESLRVERVSSCYSSEAIGRPEQEEYINAVVAVYTKLPHDVLKDLLREIEADQGRVRVDDRYAPRTLDLDIIIFGSHQIEAARIPDPGIAKWSFIYVPLLEIAPEIGIQGFDEPLDSMIQSEPYPPLQLDSRLTEAVIEGFPHE